MQAFLHVGRPLTILENLSGRSNHFREPLERSLLDFKGLIISKRSKEVGGL